MKIQAHSSDVRRYDVSGIFRRYANIDGIHSIHMILWILWNQWIVPLSCAEIFYNVYTKVIVVSITIKKMGLVHVFYTQLTNILDAMQYAEISENS